MADGRRAVVCIYGSEPYFIDLAAELRTPALRMGDAELGDIYQGSVSVPFDPNSQSPRVGLDIQALAGIHEDAKIWVTVAEAGSDRVMRWISGGSSCIQRR